MKKSSFIVILLTALVLIIASCSSSSTGSSARIPEQIMTARRNAITMENVIVGIGTANLANISQSRSTASNRALTDIVRQLEIMVDYMALDMQMSAETDPQAAVAFQMEIQRTLARQTIRNAVIIEEYQADNGQYWIATRLSRSNAILEISTAAQAANRLSPNAQVALWAAGAMDDALENALKRNNENPVTFIDTDN